MNKFTVSISKGSKELSFPPAIKCDVCSSLIKREKNCYSVVMNNYDFIVFVCSKLCADMYILRKL